MERLSDSILVAYLDGEVTRNQAEKVEELLSIHPESRQRLASFHRLRRRLEPALRLTPDPLFTQQVMDRIEVSPRPSRRVKIIALAASLTLALTAVLIVGNPEEPTPGEFTPRGGGTADANRYLGVEIFVHPKSQPWKRTPAQTELQFTEGDGFSFIVSNRTGQRRYLMVFGLDSRGDLQWYYPDAQSPPAGRSIEIAATQTVFPLPEGVTPTEVPPGPFHVVALFSDHPLTVRSVEQQLARTGLGTLSQSFPGSTVQVIALTAVTGERQ